MKQLIVSVWLLMLFGGICCIFWYNEWRYSLPTPIPRSYIEVKTGQFIVLPHGMNVVKGKPVFIHFFNPSCPCSRFNVPHFKSLVKRYGDSVNFVMVVLNKEKKFSEKEIRNRFDLDIPVLFDETIATACGVYSTPQAVLLDSAHRLYYRGNYNKNRYCTSKASNYAQIAIESLLNHITHPVFSPYALKAYGCELPVCTK